MVFTSGVIPVDPATGVIPEGVEAQATQAFTNLTNLVEASGAAMSQVVKTTVFIKEMNDFGKINEMKDITMFKLKIRSAFYQLTL